MVDFILNYKMSSVPFNIFRSYSSWENSIGTVSVVETSLKTLQMELTVDFHGVLIFCTKFYFLKDHLMFIV